jgi:hypothetical protein
MELKPINKKKKKRRKKKKNGYNRVLEKYK